MRVEENRIAKVDGKSDEGRARIVVETDTSRSGFYTLSVTNAKPSRPVRRLTSDWTGLTYATAPLDLGPPHVKRLGSSTSTSGAYCI